MRVHSMSALQVRDLEYPLEFYEILERCVEKGGSPPSMEGYLLERFHLRAVYIIYFHRGVFHGSARESEFSLSERVSVEYRSMNF